MPFSYDKLRKNFNRLRHVEDASGNYVADVFEDPDSNEMTVLPKSGANVRGVTKLAVVLAKANSGVAVSYDFSGTFYPVTASDTPTDAFIRHVDDWHKPGKFVALKGEGGNRLEGVLTGEKSINAYDAIIDAIRLSRENGNKTVAFRFGRHDIAVDGRSDADACEAMIPRDERVANAPSPRPAAPPAPREDIGGGFSLGGNSQFRK